MTPRWKIRRKESFGVWLVYLDDNPEAVAAFYVWENAITHVDNWFYDQTLRGA